jgi:hypothetical protein
MIPPRIPTTVVAALVLGITCAPCLRAQYSSSPVTAGIYGYQTVSAPAGGRIVAPVFVKDAVLSASSSVSGSTFAVAGLVANAYGPTSYNDRPNAARYYLEITGGAYAGNAYDVVSNTTGGITVSGLPGALNGQSNVPIVLRPHVTLSDLAGGSSGLTDYSDSFTIYGSGNAVSTYIYTSTGVVGDDYTTPSGHIVVYPGSAVLLNNGGTASFVLGGNVKTGQTWSLCTPDRPSWLPWIRWAVPG